MAFRWFHFAIISLSVTFLVTNKGRILKLTIHVGVLSSNKFRKLEVTTNEIKCESEIFNLANQQSYGLIQDVPEDSWMLMQERIRQRRNHKHPENPMIHADTAKVWYRENFEPDFSCPHERRIGIMGDGGKWIWYIQNFVIEKTL